MEETGDRQRIADLERRMERSESGFMTIGEQINALTLEVRIGFAKMETRQEAEERAKKHDHHDHPTSGIASIVATPERQAAAILGTMFAALIAAILQLFGIEIGS